MRFLKTLVEQHSSLPFKEKNSLASPLGKQMIPALATETLPELTERYLGLSPRSGVHTYTLYVYATKIH